MILEDSPDTLLALRSFSIEGGVIIILLIQYIPKIYKVLNIKDSLDTFSITMSKTTIIKGSTTALTRTYNTQSSINQLRKLKRESLPQRNSVYGEKFKINPNDSDIEKLGRSALASLLALGTDDPKYLDE